MGGSINARMAALAEAIERCEMEREAPVDDLSRSLFEMGRELAGLDDQGKAELWQSLDGLDLGLDSMERFISDYRKE